MDGVLEMVYLGEIVLQSKIAKKASDRLSVTYENFDEIEIWSSIQSILAAAGNLFKILWPQKKHCARGKHLRRLLNVDNDNLLSYRTFRNHFEHYDERISDWFSNQSSAVYRDLDIDPFPSTWKMVDRNKNGSYDPLAKVLTFRGKSLNLREVLDAIGDIQLNCGSFRLT